MWLELSELLNREPFIPFRITMASGQAYEVRFPGLTTAGVEICYVMEPKNDRHSILSTAQIAAVDLIE